jgi:hypothetical protein
MLPEAEAVTDAAVSALMLDASADAMDELVVPDPLQLALSAWPFTVIVVVPESYRVVYTASLPPVRFAEFDVLKDGPLKLLES